MIRRNVCFLCASPLEPVVHAVARQKHPQVGFCEVEYTDEWGVSVEIPDFIEEPQDPESLVLLDEQGNPLVKIYPTVEEVLGDIFQEAELERLGGASSGRGWSSISLFQRCPYAWKRRHIEQRSITGIESPSLAIGTLVHAFLALYFTGMMDSAYRKLTAGDVYDKIKLRANPELVAEAWRLFVAYTIYYKHENIVPLAVEYDLRDPRTGESCRYDLVAYLPDEKPGFLPGTYIFEHKTSGRFDWETLNGWQNDGECIGEVALWQRMSLDKHFGPLRGLIVNIIGKQKEPKMHRTIVSPSGWQVRQHLDDLKRWEGLINLARSSDSFPRARAGCINRYGACSNWDHCVDPEN